MTLTDALEHEWFAQYRPSALPSSPKRQSEIRATALSIRDVSMREPLSQSMSMNMDAPPSSLGDAPIPGAFPVSPQPIQRRRKVLDDAKEKGEKLVEPTPEMIERARAEQQREEEELYNRHSRPLKRKAQESAPKVATRDGGDGDEDEEMPMGLASPRAIRAARRGRGAGGNVVEVPETPVKGRGRGGAGGAGRGRGKNRHPQGCVETEVVSTDEAPRLRRSTRVPQSPGKTTTTTTRTTARTTRQSSPTKTTRR